MSTFHVRSLSKIIHQANKGQNAARYRGCIEASGDFIGFVDADDWIEPDFVESFI